MIDQNLTDSVLAFAQITNQMSDEELERDWGWGSYDSEGVRFAFFRTYEELQTLAVWLTAVRQATGHPFTESQLILGKYHSAYLDLLAILFGVPAEKIEQSPGKEEWDIRETLAHIIGADIGFHVVIQYGLDRHRSVLVDKLPDHIPEKTWGQISGLDEAGYHKLMAAPYSWLTDYHRDLHQRILTDFASIHADELEKKAFYWEETPMTIRFRLHRFESHLRQHTVQIEKTLFAINHPQNEVKQLLRFIYSGLAAVENALIGAPDIGKIDRRETAQIIKKRAVELEDILKN